MECFCAKLRVMVFKKLLFLPLLISLAGFLFTFPEQLGLCVGSYDGLCIQKTNPIWFILFAAGFYYLISIIPLLFQKSQKLFGIWLRYSLVAIPVLGLIYYANLNFLFGASFISEITLFNGLGVLYFLGTILIIFSNRKR